MTLEDVKMIDGIRPYKYLRGCVYIYFLLLEEEVVYVGKTKNINSRMRHHSKEKEYDAAFYFQVEPEYATPLERALIRTIKPECNTRETTNPPTEIDEFALDLHGISIEV